MGTVVLQTLGGPGFGDLVAVSKAPDEAGMNARVRSGQADAGLLIPADFSAGYAGALPVTLTLITDPARPEKAATAQAVLQQVTDSLAGMKIAVMANHAMNPAAAGPQIVQAYLAAQGKAPATQLVETHPQSAGAAKPFNVLTTIVAPIMGAMLIFFAFFTGGSTAQTILRESETGTLPRLFTTPTSLAAILGGKFGAVGLTVLGQVSVLLVVSHLAFGIEWGALASVVLAGLGIVLCAASFGIFLTSLLKSSRQGGLVFGGLMTLTGMIGMLGIFTGAASTPLVSLFTPQGWAIRGLTLAMNGASVGQVGLNLLAMLVISLVFFITGLVRFQKRFA
jgi:ABC-2 type transport system permease protein